MSNHIQWINRKVRLGWVVLIVGLIVAITGILLPRLVGDLPFNEKIITGFGILLIGIGAAPLIQYAAAKKDPQVARRLAAEQRDERTQSMRARAGNRAYWVSAVLAYGGLMWVSFALNGSLPQMSADSLWYFLAALVVIPFIVYISSLLYDEKNN